jgi:hypothetical protein
MQTGTHRRTAPYQPDQTRSATCRTHGLGSHIDGTRPQETWLGLTRWRRRPVSKATRSKDGGRERT